MRMQIRPGKIAWTLLAFITGLFSYRTTYASQTENSKAAQSDQSNSDFRRYGLDVMHQIETEFYIPARELYADEAKTGEAKSDKPAFMWGCGVQVTALAAAARLYPREYAPLLRHYLHGLETYWTIGNGIPGYDVLPGPKPLDRYYDDNEWMALALCETYEITKDTRYRDRAEQTFAFVLSGEDNRLGGGIFWHEQEKKSKNACSNGPAAVAALRLYQLTRKPTYLTIGRRLVEWTNSHLQDTDGLYFDNINLDGKVEKTKWSYNTALMIRADCLLYEDTRQKSYLDEAERVAKAAKGYWVDSSSGAIKDGGKFAHLLCEAFLALYEEDQNREWLTTVTQALAFVHTNVRDVNGHYADHWDVAVTMPLSKYSLIDQSSVARAYLRLAQEFPK